MATKKDRSNITEVSSTTKKAKATNTTKSSNTKSTIKRSDYNTNDDYLAALAIEKARRNAQGNSKDKSNVTEVSETKKSDTKKKAKKNNSTVKKKNQSGTTKYTTHTFNPYEVTKITIDKPESYNDKYWTARETAAKAIKNQKDLKLARENAISDNEKYIAQRDALLDSLANGTYYNPDTDPMAQQLRKDYTRQGRQAMADTMARLSAQTGGLANSYAGAMAAQAYNNYMDELGSKLNIDLRQYAENLVRNNARDYNTYNDEYVQRQQDNNAVIGHNNSYTMDEYNAKRQKNLDTYDAYGNLSDTGYNRYKDTLADYYNEVDAWLKMNGFADDARRFNETLAENARQHNDEMAYKKAALDAQIEQAQMKQTPQGVSVAPTTTATYRGGYGNGVGYGVNTNSGADNNITYEATGKQAAPVGQATNGPSDGYVYDRYAGNGAGNEAGYNYTYQNTLDDYKWK